jgi:hypothetical protein
MHYSSSWQANKVKCRVATVVHPRELSMESNSLRNATEAGSSAESSIRCAEVDMRNEK